MTSDANHLMPVNDNLLFTKLPFELRQIIFRLVLRRPHIALGDYGRVFKRLPPSHPSISPEKKRSKSKSKKRRNRLALLLVSKAVNEEATQVLYSTHVLPVYLSGSRIPVLPMPTTEALRKVQHLELYVVTEKQAAINYFRYLAHIENPKTCHIRMVCGFQCQRMMQGFFQKQHGFNLPRTEDQTGLCAKFETALISFLLKFQTIVISCGPLSSDLGKWEGCVPMIGINDDIRPPYHDMASKNLSNEICHRCSLFLSPETDIGVVNGDKARRIVIRRRVAGARMAVFDGKVEKLQEGRIEDKSVLRATFGFK